MLFSAKKNTETTSCKLEAAFFMYWSCAMLNVMHDSLKFGNIVITTILGALTSLSDEGAQDPPGFSCASSS
jgi:hypothetical protein